MNEVSKRAKQLFWQTGLELCSRRNPAVIFRFERTAHSS